jgi:hypothetical protein
MIALANHEIPFGIVEEFADPNAFYLIDKFSGKLIGKLIPIESAADELKKVVGVSAGWGQSVELLGRKKNKIFVTLFLDNANDTLKLRIDEETYDLINNDYTFTHTKTIWSNKQKFTLSKSSHPNEIIFTALYKYFYREGCPDNGDILSYLAHQCNDKRGIFWRFYTLKFLQSNQLCHEETTKIISEMVSKRLSDMSRPNTDVLGET